MTITDFSLKRYRKLVIPFVILIAMIQLTAWVCGAGFGKLQKGLWEGIKFVWVMFPPDWGAFAEMVEPALQSIAIAFVATVLGTILAVCFALAAASNITHPVLRNITRFLIGIERSLPEIIILLILIAGYGLGIFSGVVALILGCIGMLGKLLADTIEEIDPVMIESIEAVGANKLQVIWFGIMPQIIPNLVSYALFRFEINIRLSVILGAVGAGGIGYELNYAFGLLQFHRALSAMLVILVMVVATERLSKLIRNKIKMKGALKMSDQIILPSVRYKQKVVSLCAGVVVLAAVCFFLKFNPFILFADFKPVQNLLNEMLPPNFSLLWRNASIGKAIAQTLSMAFLGTFYGSFMAFVLAFLSASNTMPFKVIRTVAGGFLSLIRIIPSLVFILVFVIAVGLGPFSGMLSLVIITMGTFGKLFTDLIENAEQAPGDAIYSVGASRMQVVRYAILPQIIPSFIANCLYAFDINIRAAIGLGIFGGGGIGYELFMAMQVLHYQDALALICLIIIMVVLIEKVSDYFRIMILGKEKLK